MIGKLQQWNTAPEAEAAAEILPCNGSHAWSHGVVQQRPFASEDDLFRAADRVWRTLGETDQQQAFDSHPRIGERHARAATTASLQWSTGEQSSLGEEVAVQAALKQANAVYEQRFGRIFLVCATGKTATEMLAILESRLNNDAAAERLEAAEQQRRITQLRLRKWLGLPAARCEDV